jgi:hypothetical protein
MAPLESFYWFDCAKRRFADNLGTLDRRALVAQPRRALLVPIAGRLALVEGRPDSMADPPLT